ncbi:MAG: hypothetical protein HY961_14575 [Ignavibacteriae bacterium]|nr:hypothetical protein [Ignavibacteriota bacterium]
MKTPFVLVISLALLSASYAIAQDHQHHDAQTKKMQQESKEVYTCPMHPEVVSDKPGKCPKCGMKLVKKTAKQEMSPASMMGKPTFEKSVEGVNIQVWLMTQDEHKKMMKDHMGSEMKGMDHGKMHGKKEGKEGMNPDMMKEMMAGTHHVMVMATDEETKSVVENAEVKIAVTSPSDKSSAVELKSMKDHFGGSLTLDEKGAYTLDVWVSSKEKTRTASFKYDVK